MHMYTCTCAYVHAHVMSEFSSIHVHAHLMYNMYVPGQPWGSLGVGSLTRWDRGRTRDYIRALRSPHGLNGFSSESELKRRST